MRLYGASSNITTKKQVNFLQGDVVDTVYKITLFSVTVCLLIAISFPASTYAYKGGSGIPSCHDDIAVKKTEPGTSPKCTPPILDEETSLRILKNFEVKKIKGKWYMFISAEEFEGKFDSASRWKSISFLVSAVESMFAEKAECFIVQVPEAEKDKEALLAGDYPQKFIAASAKPVDLKDEEKSNKKWPEYHHPLFYKIVVY
jgi:hypothetical protein